SVEELRRESTPWEQDTRVSEVEGQDRQTGSLALGYSPIQGQTLKLDMLRSDETRDREQQYAYYARPYYLDTYELDRRQDSLAWNADWRSEEHTSELQSRENLVCRLLLEKKNVNSRPSST